jgi:hypothetical protein
MRFYAYVCKYTFEVETCGPRGSPSGTLGATGGRGEMFTGFRQVKSFFRGALKDREKL